MVFNKCSLNPEVFVCISRAAAPPWRHEPAAGRRRRRLPGHGARTELKSRGGAPPLPPRHGVLMAGPRRAPRRRRGGSCIQLGGRQIQGSP